MSSAMVPGVPGHRDGLMKDDPDAPFPDGRSPRGISS